MKKSQNSFVHGRVGGGDCWSANVCSQIENDKIPNSHNALGPSWTHVGSASFITFFEIEHKVKIFFR